MCKIVSELGIAEKCYIISNEGLHTFRSVDLLQLICKKNNYDITL